MGQPQPFHFTASLFPTQAMPWQAKPGNPKVAKVQPQVVSLASKEETDSYLVVHKELRSLEVPRGHTDIVFLSWMVEFGQTPVYEPQLNMR